MDDRQLVQNIIRSKMQVLDLSTFFGLLLQHLTFAIDTECPTACTDGERIFFGADFCDDLTQDELTFVLLHELMHVVLGHCFRSAGYNPALYNIASDIVVNSTIKETLGLDISIRGQDLMHLAPDGKEGVTYTAEDVYRMLLDKLPPAPQSKGKGGSASGDGQGSGGSGLGQDEDGQSQPDKGKKSKQIGAKGGTFAQRANGGCDYDTSAYDKGRLDDHSRWDSISPATKAQWQGHIVDAAHTAIEQGKMAGKAAELAERMYKALTRPTIDWRLLLNNFVQANVVDYSFMPPDRRYSDFFLPDFNEPEETVRDLWLVMDTSGSISNADMARAFSEIKGGLEQFGGALRAKISFFDAKVTPPVEFDTVEELLAIRPKGGGGTNFHAVFDYYRRNMHGKEEVTGIVIFTDGYAVFPPESAALGTPVFWLINNEMVTPPWGVVARYLPENN